MTADDTDRQPAPRFQGFHAYADDTPRLEANDLDDGAPPGDPPPRRGRRPSTTAVAALGVAAAIVAGLWLGLSTEGSPDAAASTTPVERSGSEPGAGLRVEVAKAQPPPSVPALSPTDRLEVLPPAGALVAAAPAPRRLALPEVAQAPPVVERSAPPALVERAPPPIQTAVLDVPREVAQAPPPRDAASRSTDPPSSFDCRDAASRARAMVCADPQLAALDRRMKHAYAAALGAGLAEDALRQDQDDWLDIREDAARYSRAAVVNIYRQRIAELERATEQGR